MIYKTLKFVVLGSVAMTSLGLAGAVFAETRYVTDELEVTLRSGQSTKNNIVRMLSLVPRWRCLRTVLTPATAWSGSRREPKVGS